MATQASPHFGRRPFLARTLVASALTAATVAFSALGAYAAPEPLPAAGVPDPSLCKPLDFTKAFVRTLDTAPWDRFLVVSGFKPFSSMEVVLSPVTYFRQPEYWEIDVLGCVRTIGMPVLTPYTASLRLGSTVGTKGIEVVGANHSLRIDVPARGPLKTDPPAATL
ncbi:MAG TPA: hypothetical protein VGJ60_31210 [Chloroflexota bacterium]